MSKQEDWWPSSRAALLVVLGLATGTAVVQRSPGAPARPSPAATSPADTSQTAHASGLGAAEHVIELMADSVGAAVDNFEAREAAVAWRDYLCLKTPRQPDHAHAQMMAALDAVVVDLGGRPHAETHPSDKRLAPLLLPDALRAIRAHTTFENLDPDIKKRQAMVGDYYDTAHPINALDSIEKKAAARDLNVRFVIALLPDYIDSQTRRLFDSGLAGIQQAAGRLGYTLDRFHFPGWSAHEHPGARPTSAHDSEPGALLFRFTGNKSTGEKDELLVVLIVTEMATMGVHRNALRSSIALVDAWQDATYRGTVQPPAVVRVLGPFFSGTVPSLHDTLESLNDEQSRTPRTVRIVTGTATDPGIGDQLRNLDVGGEHVSFETIVPNNDHVRSVLLEHLAQLNRKWKCGNGIALLVEGNTKFGQSLLVPKLRKLLERINDKGRKPSVPTETEPCLDPLEVTFPLHISRLRAAVDAEAPATSLLTPPAVKLKLTESTQPMDVVPSMTPELTSSVVDSAVDNLLASLHRERYTAIGIFATDARDHLFLARRIAKAIPDVLMFGTQADLLFINQEYAPFLRGTLIASSYPVFNETQLMVNVNDDEPRRQFTTASEQGAYNAALKLFGDSRSNRVKPIDSTSDSACVPTPCTPKVWLSVVGSNAIWPLEAVTPQARRGSETSPRSPEVSSANARVLARPVTAAPHSVVFAAIAVFGAALVHLVGLAFAFTASKQAPHRHHHRPHAVRTTQDIADAAKDLAAMCHWQNSRVLWNFYPPSEVGHRARKKAERGRSAS